MIYRKLLLLSFIGLVFIGCGHTNNLKYYDLKEQTVDYDYYATPDGAEAFADLPHTPVGDYDHRRGHERHRPPRVPLGIIVEIAGESMLTAQLQEKLDRAADPEQMAEAVSDGFETKVTKYLGSKRDSVNPTYLVETVLTEYRLETSSWESRIHVHALTRVIHQPTGKVVWCDDESESMALHRTPLGGLAPPPIGTVVGILNASEILSMRDEDLRYVLKQAAEEVGREIAETFREDWADSRR